ncbi:MAG: LysR family transcriptional regulator [Rhizobiaceae bacterium]
MNNIKLNNLKFFVAVYEERSISAAARKVHATQSGVSVQLRELENQLGVALFERVPTGVVPTRAGEIVYSRAVNILRNVSQIAQDVTPVDGELTGEVRVGIMPTFARSILAPVMARFARENPFASVSVTEGYSGFLTEMVLAGDLDFAIVPDGAGHDGLRSTFLDTDLEILASNKPVATGREPIDLAKVLELKLVLPGPRNARRAKIDKALKSITTGEPEILEMDSMMTTLDLIRKGEFCAILPGCLVVPDFDDPHMHLHPVRRPKMTVDYLLIEPAVVAGSAVVHAFAEQLTEEIQNACEACRTHFSRV